MTLVLSRTVNERILIGSDIVITVVDIRAGRVKLGIDAPAAVNIRREEVALKDATQEAGQ